MPCVVYCNLDKDVLFSVPKSLVCNDEIKLKKPAFNLAFLCLLYIVEKQRPLLQ